jgi:phenylalanyl-tRNA synthetase beta chain
VRRILTGLGLNEAQGQTLISAAAASALATEPAAAPPVELANPLSSDMNALRPSLVPGLLDALRHNLHHKTSEVMLFEIGRVFKRGVGTPAGESRQPADSPLREERHLAIALTGHRQSPFWSGEGREAKLDIFDLKGVLEEFLEQFGLRGLVYTKRDDGAGLFLEAATITIGGKAPLGQMGQLSPVIARRYDLRDAVLLAELNVDQLLARRSVAKAFKPLPLFPSVRRDVAMIVPESVTHEAVLNVIRQSKPANLHSVELFDVFRGANVPERHKSMAYAFTYRHAERTLTDAEVTRAHENLVEQLKQKLAASIR